MRFQQNFYEDIGDEGVCYILKILGALLNFSWHRTTYGEEIQNINIFSATVFVKGQKNCIIYNIGNHGKYRLLIFLEIGQVKKNLIF